MPVDKWYRLHALIWFTCVMGCLKIRPESR